MGKITTIKLCPACEKMHSDLLRAPVHLVRMNGTLGLIDICGEVVCPNCRARWKREPVLRSG